MSQESNKEVLKNIPLIDKMLNWLYAYKLN
jgi:hypothetical protein